MKVRLRFVVMGLMISCLPVMAQKAVPPAPAPAPSVNLVASHGPSIPPARPVARVNGATLTDHDLLREMYAIFPYAKQHGGGFPKEMEPGIRQGALKMIEFEELVYQEAARRHMAIPPERLAESEKQFRDRFETDQQYQYFLQTEAHGSEQVLQSKIKRSLLIEDFLRNRSKTKPRSAQRKQKLSIWVIPTASKCRNPMPCRPLRSCRRRSRAPSSSAPPVVTAEIEKQMRARAEAALKQAKATRSYDEFGVLAEKISEDDYRVMMGDHRAVKVTDLPARFWQWSPSFSRGKSVI